MKLDKGKPYGTLYGHNEAQFEQGGNLFDGAGDLMEERVQKKQKVRASENASSEPSQEPKNVAEAFLKALLEGGKVAKNNIYRECQSTGLDWLEVQNAATRMGVSKVQSNGVESWRLVEL